MVPQQMVSRRHSVGSRKAGIDVAEVADDAASRAGDVGDDGTGWPHGALGANACVRQFSIKFVSDLKKKEFHRYELPGPTLAHIGYRIPGSHAIICS